MKLFGYFYIPGTYQVRPHLIPETGIDVAYAACLRRVNYLGM